MQLIISGASLSKRLGNIEDRNKWFLKELSSSKGNEFVYLESLYKRYVRFEDLEATREMLEKKSGKSSFGKILYEAYLDCLAEVLLDGIDKYFLPIQLGVLHIVYFAVMNDIPLKDYDNLEGEPFWLRPKVYGEYVGQ